MIIREALSIDDVLLVPKYSEIKTRSDINVSAKLGSLTFAHPVIVANMKSVATKEMCLEAIKSGGLAILHRFMHDIEQLEIAKEIIKLYGNSKFAVSIGIKFGDQELLKQFYNLGVRIVCIDIAHGDSLHCVEMCHWIQNYYPDIFIIAGNVATGSGAKRLWEAGAHVVKVNIGSASICSTRIQTGNGIPSLTALMDIAQTKQEMMDYSNIDSPFGIIADGGLKNSGDIAKSLCFADMVMMGRVFASCHEADGLSTIIDGKYYREYAGSSTHKNTHIEGVKGLVPYQGEAYKEVLDKLLQGLRSGCSYQGCQNLRELKEDPEFVKISQSGILESHPHSIKVIS